MSRKLFFVCLSLLGSTLVAVLIFGSVMTRSKASGQSSLSDQVVADVKNQPNAPFQISEAQCSAAKPQGWQCQATLQFTQSDQTWNAYGLRWTQTFEDGEVATQRQTADRSLPPAGPLGDSFKIGEIVKVNRSGSIGGITAQGRDLRLVSVQVEPEFAIAASGKAWGDTSSPAYAGMVSMRRGYYMALARVRDVYGTQGMDGLQKLLQAAH